MPAPCHRHLLLRSSVTMDAWNPDQLRRMQLGGNDKLNKFLAQVGGCPWVCIGAWSVACCGRLLWLLVVVEVMPEGWRAAGDDKLKGILAHGLDSSALLEGGPCCAGWLGCLDSKPRCTFLPHSRCSMVWPSTLRSATSTIPRQRVRRACLWEHVLLPALQHAELLPLLCGWYAVHVDGNMLNPHVRVAKAQPDPFLSPPAEFFREKLRADADALF